MPIEFSIEFGNSSPRRAATRFDLFGPQKADAYCKATVAKSVAGVVYANAMQLTAVQHHYLEVQIVRVG